MTKLVPHSSISVSANRQRRHFDEAKLNELATSISESPYGLMHPLVVRPSGEGFELVAGERRWRAIGDVYELGGQIRFAGEAVPLGLVPVNDVGELDSLAAYEAELEENIRREDLTIVERAQATARLMDLRTKQAERDGRTAPATADIAKEIYDLPADLPAGKNNHASIIKDHLIIARHAEDADVRKAGSVKEAVKIIKKKEEARANTALATSLGPMYSTSALTLHHGDAEAWATAQPSSQFDLILTDPPYGMGADSFGDSGAGVVAEKHFYKDDYETWRSIMDWFCPESFRLAAPDAHAYVFCDLDRFHELRQRMCDAGWDVHRTPIIWHNPDGFRQPWVDFGPQRKYELILFAKKGNKKVNHVAPDLISCRKDAALGHPAQKPVGLLRDLIARSASPLSRVVDFFVGSGATLEACHEAKLPCVAIEGDAASYGMAAKRIKSLTAHDPALF